jgi:hypothetical protein
MTSGTRYYKESDGSVRAVDKLVRDAGFDVAPVAGSHRHLACIRLEKRFAIQDVEELIRAMMEMLFLRFSCRDQFFNDAELFRVDQVPTIAIETPRVVLGVILVRSIHQLP